MAFLTEYYKHVEERAKLGIPPLALNEVQTKRFVIC